MGKFLNPFTDIGFKTVFGQEENKDILIDFLNDLLEGEKRIEDLTYLDKEQLSDNFRLRRLIYDVHCVSDKGEEFIVEMQNISQDTFINRSLYYVSRAMCKQACRGKTWNYEMSPIFGIFFMNFRVNQLPEKLLTNVALYERQSAHRISDKVRLLYLQLPLFMKEKAECKTNLDYWIYVLRNMETMKEMPFKDKKKIFNKLELIAELAAMTPEEQEKHWEEADILRTNISAIDYHERIGREQGREEEKRNSARKMKEEGFGINQIHRVTGLSIEQIQQL